MNAPMTRWIGALCTAALLLLLAYLATNVLVVAWANATLSGGALALNAVVVLVLDLGALLVAVLLVVWAANQ